MNKGENVVMLKNELDPLEDFLIKPFNNLVDDLLNDPKYNKLYLAIGVTGQGKTLAITKNHIAKLFNDAEVDLIIYSAPSGEILENDKFEDAVDELSGVYFAENPYKAYNYLKKGKKVVLCTTHSGVWTRVSKYGPKLLKYVNSNKIKTAIFIDEAHTWTISHEINYLVVSGNSPVNYEARLFTEVAKIAEFSPFIFGITATPNREHTGVVTPIGTMSFNIYNEMVDKNLMVWKNSWYKDSIFFNPSDKISVRETLKTMFTDMKEDENVTGVKKVALITVKPKLPASAIEKRINKGIDTWHADIDHIPDMIKELNNTFDFWSDKDIIFSIMDENSKVGFSSSGAKEKFENEDELKAAANDLNDPLRVVIAVEKGKAGMNIFPLKYLLSMREYNTKSDDMGSITEIPIQLIGRLVRLHSGLDHEEFSKISGYDMKKYLEENPNLIEKIKTLNSFKTYTANTPVWIDAIKKLLDEYVTKLEDVPFDELKYSINAISEEEICDHCGASSKHWNKNLINGSEIDVEEMDKFFAA